MKNRILVIIQVAIVAIIVLALVITTFVPAA